MLGKIGIFRLATLLLVVLLFVQIPISQNEDSKAHINLYHLLLIVLPMYFVPGILKLRFNLAVLLFAVFVATTLIVAPAYGVGLRSTLILFAASAYCLGSLAAKKLTEQQIQKIFLKTFFCCTLFVIVRDIFYANQLVNLYAREGYVENMLYLATGGRNIEATLLGMLSILLIGSRYYKYSFILALITSAMMGSRAGLLVVGFSALFYLWVARKNHLYYLTVTLGVAVVIVMLGLVASAFIDIPLLGRFNLKEEVDLGQNDLGRLALWYYAKLSISNNIWGYGIGNGLDSIERMSGLQFVENNVHNVFLQYILDGGIQSLIVYIFLIFKIFRKRSMGQLQSNVKAFIICYLLLSFIQFNGFEAYYWYFVGLYLALPKRESERASDLLDSEDQRFTASPAKVV